MSWIGDAASAFMNPIGAVGGIAATDIGGDILTGGAISNAKSVESTNAANFAESQRNRDFQERLSGSAYQRAVADMRAAGLNPALAYANGGASTPSGATATATAPRKGDIGAGLLNTAKTVASEGASLQQVGSQTELNKTQSTVNEVNAEKLGNDARSTEENTKLIKERTKIAKEDVETAKERKKQAKMDTDVQAAEVPVKKNTAENDAIMSDWDAMADRIKSFIPFTRSNARSYKNSVPVPHTINHNYPNMEYKGEPVP